MQHFLNLERCTCGAYRYLAVREHKKSYEICMIHHKHLSPRKNDRKYRKLASIPKFKTNFHDSRVDQEMQERPVKISFEEATVLKSLLKQVESSFTAATSILPEEDIAEDEEPAAATFEGEEDSLEATIRQS